MDAHCIYIPRLIIVHINTIKWYGFIYIHTILQSSLTLTVAQAPPSSQTKWFECITALTDTEEEDNNISAYFF